MRIWLNDFELNNPDKRIYINDQIEGLDLPAIRTSRGERSGQAGSYIGAQVFSSRSVAITGTIFSADVYEAREKRREIQAALPLYPDEIVVRIEDDDGRSYSLVAQLISFKMPIERSPIKSAFKIELEAPYPVIYDTTAGSRLTATINKAVPGGMQFSSTTPQFGGNLSFYFSAGSPNSTVDNSGTVTVFPLIVITGQISNPVITNLTTGEVFSMTAYSVSSDAVTQIDMLNHTVRLGNTSQLVNGVLPDAVGDSVFGYVADSSEWFGIVPGINEFSLTSGSGSDASSAVISWLPGLMGI